MPLSEDEQRILREIEAQLYADDPKLAREVGETSVYRHAGRQLKLAAVGVLVGLLLMVVLLGESVLLSLVGFGIALASGVWAYYAFRRVTRAGINDLRRGDRPGWLRGLTSDRPRRRSDD